MDVTHRTGVGSYSFSVPTASTCPSCNSRLVRGFRYVGSPQILAFDLSNGQSHPLEQHRTLVVEERQYSYILRGIIYHGNDHFTARVITEGGGVWYHDEGGAVTKYCVDGKSSLSGNFTYMKQARSHHNVSRTPYPTQPCNPVQNT
ncbi:hypothetical protein BD779DRAFT_1476546 [Infundibulicybe gibba]|nr:hypothetical protein BD779DRAFT_1476546 [Infundibulicybe gibba]